jgi:hypothetical protein
LTQLAGAALVLGAVAALGLVRRPPAAEVAGDPTALAALEPAEIRHAERATAPA